MRGRVAQLDRALASGAKGRGFESRLACHFTGMKRYSAFISVLLLFFCSGNLSAEAEVFLSTYEEIKSAYDLIPWNSEKVPRIFVKKIPEEIKKLEGVERRHFFIKLLLPLVLLENEKISAEHDMIVPIAAKQEWNAEDVKVISETAQKYNIIDEAQDISAINEDEKEKIRYFLDHKIRPVPPAIAIGQAALESGWGTSRFVFEGNNLFGHVSPDPTKGLLNQRKLMTRTYWEFLVHGE